MNWILGLCGSALIAFLAYQKRSLTLSGALAAVLVGTVLYGAGSLPWFGTLILFFLSSTLLTKWKTNAKSELEANYEKTGRRDAGQVFANGGLGVLLCLLAWLWPHPLWWWAFLGVMATVNADTWATEVGGLSKRPPRFLLTLRQVAPGTSGGVSGLGLLASLLGGLFIGGSAWGLSLGTDLAEHRYALLWIGGAAGLFGSLFDSLLGATLQAMFKCPVCGKETERREHCKTPTLHLRGLPFLSNDLVNLAASAFGGAVAVWCYILFYNL
ncbi:uncharacterized protein (TIGR00297 family) [Tumebacillus sp. BK434]|uniref:DUF92 domain-containing protein n=1 Tax=Tumebacillus sp. BK434 TaxID=2512169 RepID=UPI001047A8BB|nr:DUF92 domain-containing protein [Tumebacillus sp. BK434]TCP53779.1 uncharacterized protein (TIGR00297 family) [Tumebacillus sp. BK434]